MLQGLFAFAMLFILIAIFSFTLWVMDKAKIMQTESPVDDSMFFSTVFQGVKPSSLLSDSIDPPEVTINHGYFGTCSHVPRETAAVILNKPVALVDSSESCLHEGSYV